MENENAFQSVWSIVVPEKKKTFSRNVQSPLPSNGYENKTWKIEPKSIFDYDPLEDGKESLSLSFLHDGNSQSVWEGYGKRKFPHAKDGSPYTDDEETIDPATNHKPLECPMSPLGFKLLEEAKSGKKHMHTTLNVSCIPTTSSPINNMSDLSLDFIDGNPSTLNHDFGKGASFYQKSDQADVFSPDFTDFNRKAKPFSPSMYFDM